MSAGALGHSDFQTLLWIYSFAKTLYNVQLMLTSQQFFMVEFGSGSKWYNKVTFENVFFFSCMYANM